jgi:drug/metabolite transporter (DMT)-like permease
MNNQNKAYLFAGISIFFWSTVASAFKIGLGHLSYIQFLFIACLVSLCVFAVLIPVQGKSRLLLTCSAGQYLYSALLGMLNPFVYYLVLFKAYSLLPAQVAQPLNMIWPVVLVFLSIPLLRQKVAVRSFIALFVCFAGVYLISSQGEPFSMRIRQPLGVLLAVISALIWSLFWLLNVRDKRDETVKLGLNFFFASIYIIPVLVFFEDSRSWPLAGVMLAVYAGIFEMGITFFFWMKALRLTRSTAMISTLVYLAPFLSLYIIHIFVGERIMGTSILGLLLIVAGIVTEKIPFKRNKTV